jgi:hypothetical protein
MSRRVMPFWIQYGPSVTSGLRMQLAAPWAVSGDARLPQRAGGAECAAEAEAAERGQRLAAADAAGRGGGTVVVHARQHRPLAWGAAVPSLSVG